MSEKYYYDNYINKAETGITTTATIENLYPLTNIADIRPSKKVKSSDENLPIVFDLKTIESIDSFLFLADTTNDFEYETILIEGNATNEWSAAAYSTSISLTPTLVKWGIIQKEITAQTYRFWRLTFTNTAGTGYCAVGKVFIGKKMQLVNDDINLGWMLNFRDLSKIQKNKNGNFFADERTTQRVLNGGYKLVGLDNLDVFTEFYLTNYTYKPFWLVMDDTETIVNHKGKLSLYCRFLQLPSEKNSHFAKYDFQIRIEEVL